MSLDFMLQYLDKEYQRAKETCAGELKLSMSGSVWGEVARLARLGAAVEAIPHNIGIHHGAADITGDWFILIAVELEQEMRFFKTATEAVAHANLHN